MQYLPSASSSGGSCVFRPGGELCAAAGAAKCLCWRDPGPALSAAPLLSPLLHGRTPLLQVRGYVWKANTDSVSFSVGDCVCFQTDGGDMLPFRASDDLEKTNTTYAEDSQPTQGRGGVKIHPNLYSGAQAWLHHLPLLEITVHLDESDALSAASCHDGESERFVSTGYAGRRVSFNESALYEKEKTAQSDKVRR